MSFSPSSDATSNVVAAWLHGIGLDYAIEMFDHAGIVTPAALADLDVAFFPALGIHNSDDRRKLFYLVQRVKMQYNNAVGGGNSHSNKHESSNDAVTTSTSIMSYTTNESTGSRKMNIPKSDLNSTVNAMISSTSWHPNESNQNKKSHYPNSTINNVHDPQNKFMHNSNHSHSGESSNSSCSSNRLSPHRTAVSERNRQQQQLTQYQNELSDTSFATASPAATRSMPSDGTNPRVPSSTRPSSPLAAIKSRMRRLENTRQKSRETLQTANSIASDTEFGKGASATNDYFVSSANKVGNDHFVDDDDEFFDSVEEVDTHSDEQRQNKRQQRARRTLASRAVVDNDDDDQHDGFWESNTSNDGIVPTFCNPSTTGSSNLTTKTQKRISTESSQSTTIRSNTNKTGAGASRRNANTLLSVPNQVTRRSERLKQKHSTPDKRADNGSNAFTAIELGISSEKNKHENDVVHKSSIESSFNDATRSEIFVSKPTNSIAYQYREATTSRKIDTTDDEEFDGANANDTSVNESFCSSVTTLTLSGSEAAIASLKNSTKGQRSQQSRPSSLQAPNRRVEQPSSRSSLVQPIKSIRTGKQLSSIPSDDVLPMSPLLDLPPNELVSNYEDNFSGQHPSHEVGKDFDSDIDDERPASSNVTTRRNSSINSKRRESLSKPLSTLRKHGDTFEQPHSTTSYGNASASLVSDDEIEIGDDSLRNDIKRTDDISADEIYRLNNSKTSVLSTVDRIRNRATTSSRRSSIERPRSGSARRDGPNYVSGISAPRTTDYASARNDSKESNTNSQKHSYTDRHNDNDEFGVTMNDSQKNPAMTNAVISNRSEQRKRRESFQTVGMTVNDRSRTRSLSRPRRSLSGLADEQFLRNSHLHDNGGTTIQGLLNASTTSIANSACTRVSNTATITYQGQREDDSFKAQIQSIRQDVDNDHQAFTDSSEKGEFVYVDDQEMRIRVLIRKRPMTRSEVLSSGDVDIIHPLDYSTFGKVLVYQPKTRVDLTKEIETASFAFDNVFDEMKSNVDIYERAVRHVIPSFFQGQWTSIFAYGQTGSGKTYTMMGCNMTGIKDGSSNPNDVDNLGLYYMAALDIFNALKLPEHKDLTLAVSLFEIYAGKLFDLLNERKIVRCLEDAKGKVCFPGLSEHGVACPDDLITLIEKGSRNRSCGTTSRNADSSRSHAVLQLHLLKAKSNSSSTVGQASSITRMTAQQRIAAATTAASRRNATGSTLGISTNAEFSRLTFIDLAGSERGADTQSASRATRLEGAEINTSLLALKEVIRALAKNDQSALSHVPFRGSKLTQVLKESFVGKQSKCIMIACISPNIMNCEQTLNTLRYADRVKERNTETGQMMGLPSTNSEKNGVSNTSLPSSSNIYRLFSEKLSQSAMFGVSSNQDQLPCARPINSGTNSSRKNASDFGDIDIDRELDLLNVATNSSQRNQRNRAKSVGRDRINFRSGMTAGSPKAIAQHVQQRNRTETRNSDVDSLFSDDEVDSHRIGKPVETESAVQVPSKQKKATEMFEPTPRERTSLNIAAVNGTKTRGESKTSIRKDNFLTKRQSSDHSLNSDSSAVLDALLATPHERKSGKPKEFDEDTDEIGDEENDVDDLASHYITANVHNSRAAGAKGDNLSAIKRTHLARSSFSEQLQKTVTPSTIAKRRQEQVYQTQLESEKDIIVSDVIGTHKKALSSMLQMIKDEMVLVNSADTDRELFLNDYVTQVQDVHEKQLEWIALLREHLLKYRIISNATSNSEATEQSGGKPLNAIGERSHQMKKMFTDRHGDNFDDDSFEDLRD